MGECRIPVASISRLSPSTRTKVTLQFVRVEGESLEIEARLTVYNVLQQDSWEYHTQHDTYMYMHMYLYVQHVYTCIHTGTCICTRQSLNTVEYMYVHYRIHTLFVHVHVHTCVACTYTCTCTCTAGVEKQYYNCTITLQDTNPMWYQGVCNCRQYFFGRVIGLISAVQHTQVLY